MCFFAKGGSCFPECTLHHLPTTRWLSWELFGANKAHVTSSSRVGLLMLDVLTSTGKHAHAVKTWPASVPYAIRPSTEWRVARPFQLLWICAEGTQEPIGPALGIDFTPESGWDMSSGP